MTVNGAKMYHLLFAILFAVFAVHISAEVDVEAFDYDAATLESSLKSSAHFLLLYSGHTDCTECEAAQAVARELMGKYNDGEERTVTVAELDCSKNEAYCTKLGADAYPAFYFLQEAKTVKYIGDVKKADLEAFITEQSADAGVVAVSEGLYTPTGSNFKSFIGEGNHFIKFYAPWCGHCKKLAPTWDQLAKEFVDSTDVKISKIDCTAHKQACTDFAVRGYPTLKFISDGEEVAAYSGNRGLEALKKFVTEEVAKRGAPAEGEEAVPEEESEAAVLELTDEDFADVISSGNTFVKFYAPWCGHCKRLAPVWEELGEAVADSEDITIAKIDCTLYRDICTQNEVKGYPTLYLFKEGERQAKYSKGRDLKSLKSYLLGEFERDEL